MATYVVSLFNGERTVVVLFPTRILFCIPKSLYYESLGLCLLAFAGLFIEISSENSSSLNQFKPSYFTFCMLSRLIHLSRAVESKDIGPQELDYLIVQYWAVSATCFGVLLFLCCLIRYSTNATSFLRFRRSHGTDISLLYMSVYVAVCCFSLARQSDFGEALLVTSGLVLYFGDMIAYTLAKPSRISCVLWFFSTNLSPAVRLISPQTHAAEETDSKVIESSLLFYASLIVTLVMIAPAWMQFVQGFHHHPLLWILNFVFEEPLKRLALCIYWVSVICASALRFYNISKSSKIERILLPKYYHLVAVLMFSPALIFQSSFLDLAFVAALDVFLILKIVRVWKIWPLGKHINQFMNVFTDHRDSKLLIVSHLSLLLGCALPKWLSTDFNDRTLSPFAGILSLGIGDTMASMVGYKYGVLRWSKTEKTIEGTAAGITSVLAACSVLLPLLASTSFIISQHWISLLIAVTVSGLLEAYTA
ncbi:hypothetical protein MKW92_028794 [Papaver armeniacum]|nr:hypothetical protein MKW92_028794 [Papaver armeniacum]